MPIRIMTWNIQDFAISKTQPSEADPDALRWDHIRDNIAEVNPDILIVVEIETGGSDGRSCVVTNTSGGPAVIELLGHLRAVQAGDDWMVVPPLILGDAGSSISEGIAVFFKNTRLDFAGPFQLSSSIWGRAQMGTSLGGSAETYKAPWDNALPDEAPVGPAVGNNLNQNQLAGRCLYGVPGFPGIRNRPPFQTTLREKDGGGAYVRKLNLFSVHLPADSRIAQRAVESVAEIDDIQRAAQANEIRIITGDFNINPLRLGAAPNMAHYDPITNLGYQAAVTNTPTHMTTLLRSSTRGIPDYYGYMSQGPPLDDFELPSADYPRKLLDNFFVDPAPAGLAATVVNRVFGPGGVSAMDQTIPQILANPLFNQDQKDAYILQTIEYFGKIRGASDHMAIYMDI